MDPCCVAMRLLFTDEASLLLMAAKLIVLVFSTLRPKAPFSTLKVVIIICLFATALGALFAFPFVVIVTEFLRFYSDL
jgi:hypothetical protein